MRLRSLLEHVGVRRVQGDLEREVTAVGRDTREIGPGGVFVAIRGAKVDGHDLVGKVPHAAAVVVERSVQVAGPAVVEVADTRKALAELAAAFHGHPGAAMQVVGVTGTNGKTTITTLVEEGLRGIGIKAGRIGTTGVSIDGTPVPTALTTPEAPEVQGLLARMRDAGCQAVTMEASSVGLVQHRIDGIPFHTGVFTNLSRDHLDIHGTMEAYRNAKALLFEQLRPAGGPPRAILCGEDPAWPTLRPPADRWLYGFGDRCHIRVRRWEQSVQGLVLDVDTPEGSAGVRSPLVGRYNALNLAAALGICLTLGLSPTRAAEALATVRGVPGRLERVDNDRGLLVLVDYAHTPDALANALNAVRGAVSGRLWVVFGCGGDRDPGKRPQMGRVAERADRVVVTSDNPRSEDPQSIVDAILSGMDGPPAHVDVDRRAAIGWALARAEAGDAVLIAGKGHEPYQEIAGTKHPFDDRLVAAAWLGEAS